MAKDTLGYYFVVEDNNGMKLTESIVFDTEKQLKNAVDLTSATLRTVMSGWFWITEMQATQEMDHSIRHGLINSRQVRCGDAE